MPGPTRQRERTSEEETETEEETGCPECESDSLVRSADGGGELVCEDCGLVIEEENIDRGPEWRAFNHSERQSKSRVGAPTTQKWQERIRTKDAGERNLQFALSEIDRMSSALGVPRSVREVASVIYRRALDDDLIRGRSIEGVATAALYAAARQLNNPRSLDEFAAVSRVEKMEMTRTYRYIVRQLGLEVKPADPEQYVPRFVSRLDLDEEVEREARALLRAAKDAAVTSGKSPVGLAAAAVYAAALLTNQKVTQSQVGEVADISEVTIRNRYKELLELDHGELVQ